MKLGDRLEDAITGFVGIATATMEHLHGRFEFQLTAKDDDDGNQRIRWFDAQRLVPAPEQASIGFRSCVICEGDHRVGEPCDPQHPARLSDAPR